MENALNVEGLIGDLALIMALAAISTIVFKLLKQPVVLGYIVAGFLASPDFALLPSVANEANIEFWAQIGIVVLLFCLGLEFSFKKLVSVGGSAMMTALIIVCGMLLVGYATGISMGLSSTNCLFLGGMLSMSSTTIIIKALSDLNMRQQKFTSMVFAVLVVEDMFAVVLMVLLSSVAIHNQLDGKELTNSVLSLGIFLIFWFTVGVFIIPSIFRKLGRKINDEMLLVISVALCFGMAVYSASAGFSMAFGAFVMGSILAGTPKAEQIEHVMNPVKDLFGAVFFISVGMMVKPDIIMLHAGTIALLSVVVTIGMAFFGTLGMLVMGQSLKVSIQSGMCLTQIGEFSFIIATLGMSLGVLNDTLYPIIVAVSVITTFFTPYFIKLSEPASRWVEAHLPEKVLKGLERYSERGSTTTPGVWSKMLKTYGTRLLLYSVIVIALISISTYYLHPAMVNLFGTSKGTMLSVVITLAVIMVPIYALASPNLKGDELKKIRSDSMLVPFVAIHLLRVLLACAFIIYYLNHYYRGSGIATGVLLVVAMVAFMFSPKLRKRSHFLEDQFLSNLHERDLARSGKDYNIVSGLHLARMRVNYGCPFVGEKLRNSDLRRRYGVNIVSITRGQEYYLAPDGEMRIFPGDRLAIVGTDEQIQEMLPIVEREQDVKSSQSDVALTFQAIPITATSPVLGKTSASANFRSEYGATLIAIERNGDYVMPNGQHRFREGDVLWIAGDERMLKALK